MNLDIFNKVGKILENNEVNNLIQKLSNKLENTKSNYNFDNIEDIKNEYKLTSESVKKISKEYETAIEEYSSNLNTDVYYITYKNKDTNKYLVSHLENGKRTNTYIPANELPDEVKVNMVLKKENENFSIDLETSKKIMNKTLTKIENIVDEQNQILKKSRDGCSLYQVVENKNDSIYLLNTNTNKIFEETNLSNEILNKATTDMFLRYENGEYFIDYKLTDEFFKQI